MEITEKGFKFVEVTDCLTKRSKDMSKKYMEEVQKLLDEKFKDNPEELEEKLKEIAEAKANKAPKAPKLKSRMDILKEKIEMKENEIQEERANLSIEKDELSDAEHSVDIFYPDEDDYTDQYNDFLDELYGDVNVAGYSYSTSDLLYRIDPTAWGQGLSQYVDGLDFDELDEYVELKEKVEELESNVESIESKIEELEEELEELQEELEEEEEE